MTLQTFQYIAYGWLVLAVAVHITMFFITAPFGRHTSERWGFMINNKLGWFIMELPSFSIMLYFLLFGTHSKESLILILVYLDLIFIVVASLCEQNICISAPDPEYS